MKRVPIAVGLCFVACIGGAQRMDARLGGLKLDSGIYHTTFDSKKGLYLAPGGD